MKTRVATAPVGRLATVDDAGQPHLVPFCFALEADTIYSAIDQKPKTTTELKRLANIRDHPHVSVLVDHYDDDWSYLWWVRMDGTAQEVGDGTVRERALALLADKYEQYRQNPPTGPVLAIDIARWQGWEATALG